MSFLFPTPKPKKFEYKPRFSSKEDIDLSDLDERELERERLRRELDQKWKRKIKLESEPLLTFGLR